MARIWLFATFAVIFGPPAGAVSIEEFGRMIADNQANAFLQGGLDRLHLENCDGGQKCPAATAAERKQPPISVGDAKGAMAHAMMGAWADFCGLDSNRALLPMLAFGKQVKKFGTRQLALMTTIYSDFKGRQLAAYKQKARECPPNVRAEFDKSLPKLK